MDWSAGQKIAWTAKRFSGELFVPRSDSFPMNKEKKTLIPYINNGSKKELFWNSQRNVINSKFHHYQILHNICMRMFFAQLLDYFWNWIEKFKHGSTTEIWYHCKYKSMKRNWRNKTYPNQQNPIIVHSLWIVSFCTHPEVFNGGLHVPLQTLRAPEQSTCYMLLRSDCNHKMIKTKYNNYF